MLHELLEVIRHPEEEAKGYTRWWWYGCAVTREGIATQLEAMSASGFGGVEIQILYPIRPDNPEKGIRNIPFFSPEFFDILSFTQLECEKRGLRLDLTLGSSWPFGGPFVPSELAMQCAIPYQIDLHGPCEYECDLTTRIVGEVSVAVMGRMQDCVMLPETVTDITDRFVVKHLFGWPWGTRMEPLHIPEGNWKIVFFVIHRYRQMVGKPAPNAEGYVIDHCRSDAVSCFFENMVQPISNHLGYGAINSFFCDSIECDGHNWSGILLDEFQKRRGYDLRPHAYALWGDLGDISPDVRHDYFLTMSELTIENFFEPFTAWSKRNGAQARIQAHGTWADILKAYATADIPEGETFGDQNVLGCNTIHRRLAVSAGHLYGKKIISNETFTWLCKPRFTETPEILKAAVDAVFLDGMNMIVNHGFPYSEPDAEERLPFYASCHLCNDTPWWPHYRHLARYIQTVSALLRRGRHVSEIGIFLPQADIWSDNLLSDLHMAMKLEEHIGRDVADAIAKAGYWFDYLNDDALVRLGSLCEGGIRIGGNEYRVILLIGCTRLDEKTAECLHAFVEAGGVLIAAEQIPLQGCGLMDRKQKDERVRSCIEELFGSKRQPGSVRPYLTYEQCSEESDQNGIRSGQIAPESQSTDVRAFKRHVGKGDAIFVPDRRASLISALQDTLRPDVTLSCPDTVGYVHREEGDTHFYFLSNISPKECRNTAFFRDRHTGFRVFSPETGEEIHAHSFEEASDGMRVVLDHPPYGALVVFFSPEVDLARVRMNGAVEYISETDLVNWTFSVPSLGFTASMPEPTSWEEQPALHYYSGEGRYACTFTLDAEILPDQQVRLVLTSLFCSAEVWVNGFHAGDLWKSPYHLDIGRHLHQGSNNLLLVVTNPLINELLNPGLRDTPLPIVLPYWPYFGNVINNIRQERLSYEAERAAILTPQRSGLSGSVRLCVMNPSM